MAENTAAHSHQDTVRVLSIDGGGIRGIIPAIILAELENGLSGGRRLYEAFDLIAGTSTGGIIALALGTPCNQGRACRPQELLRLYVQDGPRIFKKRCFGWFRSFFCPKYSPRGLEEILHSFFGATRLSSALTHLLVSSYDIEAELPFFFKSHKARTSHAYDGDVAEIARATSAAPTFFPPALLVQGQQPYTLVDGGVCVNNPAMAAFAEACWLFPNRSRYIVVSVGTGDRQDHYTYRSARKWGLLGWASKIVPVFMDSVSEAADYELRSIPACDFFRLQPDDLSPASNQMDDVSPQNIANLQTVGQAFVNSPCGANMLEMLYRIL